MESSDALSAFSCAFKLASWCEYQNTTRLGSDLNTLPCRCLDALPPCPLPPHSCYNTTLKAILVLPDPRDKSTYPPQFYPVGSEVIALYPETTSFYKARIVGLPGSGKVSWSALKRRAQPCSAGRMAGFVSSELLQEDHNSPPPPPYSAAVTDPALEPAPSSPPLRVYGGSLAPHRSKTINSYSKTTMTRSRRCPSTMWWTSRS